MTPKVKKFFEAECEDAESEFLADGCLHFQVKFLAGTGENIQCSADVPHSLSDRDRLVDILRLVAIAHAATAVIVSMECWVAPAGAAGRPSEHPDRTKALQVMLLIGIRMS